MNTQSGKPDHFYKTYEHFIRMKTQKSHPIENINTKKLVHTRT